MSFFAAATPTTASADVEIGDPPTDSISSMEFSPQADYLGVGSWDNSVRIYEIGADRQAQGKAMYLHQVPVLSVCWNKEGNKLFSGGTDNIGRVFDITTGQSTQVAQHDAPIKTVKWVDAPQAGLLATGSWDSTIKYWDLRAPAPVVTVTIPERCYSFDVKYPLLVVGTAGRHIQIYNLNNPNTPYKTIVSPLKWQTRVVSCFTANNKSGFAVGSVEGRVAIHFVEDKEASNNFSFRCHRRGSDPSAKEQSLIYPVNDISFHPIHGSCSTCGSDGTFHFWDLESRVRLKSFDQVEGPITTTSFNRNGSIFAYAISYDWSKGYQGMTPGHPNKLMLHDCKDDEVKKKNKKT